MCVLALHSRELEGSSESDRLRHPSGCDRAGDLLKKALCHLPPPVIGCSLLSSEQTLLLSKTTLVRSILLPSSPELPCEASGCRWCQGQEAARGDVLSSSALGGLEARAACKALVEKIIPFPLDNGKWLCSTSHQMPKHYNPIMFSVGKPDTQS